MTDKTITLNSYIDPDTYRKFALYDVINVKRNWIRPAVFALCFTAISLIGFIKQLWLPAILILLIGLGFPTVYYITFYRSITAQAKQYTARKKAFTLTFADKGITVSKGKKTVSHDWGGIHSVHRLKTCICIYTDSAHALLLAGRDNEQKFDEVMQFIKEHMDASRIHGRS